MSGLDRDAAAAFLDATLGNEKGFAALAFGREGYFNERARYAHKEWTEASYAWPTKRGRLLDDVARELVSGKRVDVYVSPYVRATKRRSKGDAVSRRLLHADRDGLEPLDLWEGLLAMLPGAFVVDSGSPGHVHIYLPVTRDLDLAAHELLCRGLAAKLGRTDSKFSDNDLLRLPGTVNFKHDPPRPVRWLRKPGPGAQPTVAYLESVLDVDLAAAPPPSPNGRGPATAAAPVVEVDDEERLPSRVREALKVVTGDRSEDTFRVVAACYSAGLTLADTRGVIILRDDLRGRLAGRHDDDVLTCWLRAIDSRQVVYTDLSDLVGSPQPPVAAKEETTPLPARDPAIAHGLVGEVVAALDPYTEADRIGVLVSLLAGLGVIIGPSPHIRIGATRHPLLTSPLLFGPTSTGRKGDATNTAKALLQAAALDCAEIVVTGLSSGEGLIERIRDPDDDDDDERRKKPGGWNGTADKRLWVIEPEFSSVMARAKRDGNTLAGVLRQAWDGDRLSVLNKTMVRASASHVAVLGHITPREFRLRLAEGDLAGGTYNRFLPVYVERSKRLPLPDGMPSAEATRLADRLRQAIAAARKLTAVSLGEDAARLWSDELYDEFSGVDDDEAAWVEFTRRAAPYCLRIAALYAVLDGRRRVTSPDLTAAAALVRYSVGSARYVLARARRDPRLDRIKRALDEGNRDGLTKTEIHGLFSRNLPGAVLEELLAQVLSDPHYEMVQIATGGRPVTRYRRTTDGNGGTA